MFHNRTLHAYEHACQECQRALQSVNLTNSSDTESEVGPGSAASEERAASGPGSTASEEPARKHQGLNLPSSDASEKLMPPPCPMSDQLWKRFLAVESEFPGTADEQWGKGQRWDTSPASSGSLSSEAEDCADQESPSHSLFALGAISEHGFVRLGRDISPLSERSEDGLGAPSQDYGGGDRELDDPPRLQRHGTYRLRPTGPHGVLR